MAQRNVEWYSVHTDGVTLREMAQRNVEWYGVHTNGVELREMAQRNVEWYSVHTNGEALCRITLQNIRRSIWTLYCLAIHEIFRCCGESSSLFVAWREGYLAETTKNINRQWNSDLLGGMRSSNVKTVAKPSLQSLSWSQKAYLLLSHNSYNVWQCGIVSSKTNFVAWNN